MVIGPGAAEGDYRLDVFGAGSLSRAGAPVRLRSRRTLALTWYVVAARAGVGRAALAELFWPSAEPAVRRGNLRVVLSTLHSQAPGLLEADRDVVRRGAADLDTDADDFERWCRVTVVGVDPDERLSAVTRAGEFLRAGIFTSGEAVASPDFQSWADTERTRLQLRYVDAVAVLGEALAGSPRAGEALEAAQLAARLDEFNGPVQLLIASGLAANGDSAAARRHLAAWRAASTDEGTVAGTQPPGADKMLGVAGSSVAKVLDRLDPLPPRERLVGRTALLDRIQATLAGGRREVTLTGAGGVGKTALATELAHRARDRGQDAVVVDLVAVDDPEDVKRAIVDTLGDRPHDEPERQSLTELGTLLVLDNFEQVLAAAPVIGELLDGWPMLSVVVTSRVPLRVAGEHVVVIPSLDLRGHGMTSAAGQLFAERAARHGVAAEQLDTGRVAEVCRLLDGLPLAIELAAAQCAPLGLPAVIDLVRGALSTHDLGLLRAVDPGVSVRHGSLDAVVLETLSLLGPDARGVLASAAAFEGYFTADALIAVTTGLADTAVTRAALTALTEASLVRARTSRSPGAPVWYRLPPPVRAVAARLLDQSVARDAVLRARVTHDVGAARTARAGLSGADTTAIHRGVDRYLPSLRATYDKLIADHDPRRLELLTGVVPYRWAMGDVATCAGWLRVARLGDRPAAGDDPILWASAALWQEATDAELLGLPSNPAGIDDLVDRVLHLVGLLDQHPPADGAASAAVAGIHTLDACGRSLDALALVTTARRIAAGSPALLASIDYHEAKLLHGLGDDAAADALLRRIVSGADRHGNRRCALEAGLLVDLVGLTGSRGGRRETLTELLDEAIGIGDRRQVIWTLVSLGAVDVLDGRVTDAVGWFRQALGVARPFGYALGLGSCLLGGAAIALLRGDVEAAQLFDGSLDGELPALNRALPRAYVDAYRVVHQDLADRREQDPAQSAAWSRGRTLPRSRVIERLDGYLTGASGHGRGTPHPATDSAEAAALRAVGRGET